MSDIGEWLQQRGLASLAEVFEREHIDMEALRTLSESDLKDLGLPVGLRGKLRAAIQALLDAHSMFDGGRFAAFAGPRR